MERSYSRSMSMHEAKDQLLRRALHRELIRVTSSRIDEHDVLKALDTNGALSKENSIRREVGRCASMWKKKSMRIRENSPLEPIQSGNIPTPPPPPPAPNKKPKGPPPPPPPGAKGKKGPPPPPGKKGAKLDPKVANKKKLKMLHWDKLRRASSGSMWQSFKGEDPEKIIDTKKLEELFKIQDSKKVIEKKGGSDNVVRYNYAVRYYFEM
eukprot:TRINITY_DN36186_c0_g1_i19.p1 TRINITY_DN36186_c0_g1~~TRINITY_DN36186_c0_g1_i19.p1  ORF type:complete len:210 (-),score=39.89 TRINITY_DN36186_c0_g1_i19:55-684(-)